MSKFTSALVESIGLYGYELSIRDVLDRAASAVVRKFGDVQRPMILISLAGVVEFAYFPGVHGLRLLHAGPPDSPASPTRVVDVVMKVLKEYECKV
jgi:hypothetical protein